MLSKSTPRNKNYDTFSLYDYLLKAGGKICIESTTEILISKNDHVYKPPQNEGFIYEILEGAVKLGSYSEQGEEYVHDILQKKDFFGNLKYLNGQFFEFSKALIDTRLRVYNLYFFKKTITKDPFLADWFISYILKRWCTSEKKLGNISGNDTRERLRFLMHLFDVTVKDAQGEEYLLFELLTQKNLGDLAGATRQTIAHLLREHHSVVLSTPG